MSAATISLYDAVEGRREDDVRQLLKQSNANPNWQTPETGLTPLCAAATLGSQVCILALLEHHRTDPNKKSLGNVALHMAGDMACVTALLADPRTDVNLRNKNRETALHIAVAYNQAESVCALLADDRTEVHSCNKEGRTALEDAARLGYHELVAAFLGNPRTDPNLGEPLIEAVRAGQLRCVEAFMANDRTLPNKYDWSGKQNGPGRTALFYATTSGNHRIVEALLANSQTNPNDPGNDRSGLPTPLAIAGEKLSSESGELNIEGLPDQNHGLPNFRRCFDVLLADRRTDPNLGGNSRGGTVRYNPLTIVIFNNDILSMEALLNDPRIQIDEKNSYGLRPLHAAATSDLPLCVAALLKHGADPNVRSEGMTPLHCAVEVGSIACAELLLSDPRIDPNSATVTDRERRRGGVPPLWTAVAANNIALTNALLAHELIDINKAPLTGDTPLWIAAQKGNHVCLEALLRAGASPFLTRPTHYGQKNRPFALDEARKQGHAACVGLLQYLFDTWNPGARGNLRMMPRWNKERAIRAVLCLQNFGLPRVVITIVLEYFARLLDKCYARTAFMTITHHQVNPMKTFPVPVQMDGSRPALLLRHQAQSRPRRPPPINVNDSGFESSRYLWQWELQVHNGEGYGLAITASSTLQHARYLSLDYRSNKTIGQRRVRSHMSQSSGLGEVD